MGRRGGLGEMSKGFGRASETHQQQGTRREMKVRETRNTGYLGIRRRSRELRPQAHRLNGSRRLAHLTRVDAQGDRQG